MKCKDVIEVIEQFFPKYYAMNWDNVGLLAGCEGQEVKKIYIALDLTDDVIYDAIETKADMIVTHHPLIFSPLHSVTDKDFIGKRMIQLIQNHICYYAMHTNYDVVRMSDLAAEIMGLQDVEVLENCFPDEKKGIGKIGLLKNAMTLKECCEYVKEKFQLEHVKIFGDPKTEIKKVALLPGSGKSAIDTAKEMGADVLITGDIGHHEGIDAVAKGISIMDAGHYGIEHIYIRDMEKFFRCHIPELQIETAKIRHPFQIF